MSNQPPYPPGHPPNDPRYQAQYPPQQPPPYGYPPLQPPPGAKRSWLSRQTTQTKVVLAGAAALVVGLIVAIAASNSGGSGGSQISGSRDEWLQAVCKDGSYRTPTIDMPVFRGASGSGLCVARAGGAILIGQWDSEYMMRNAFSGGRLRYYAAANDGDLVTGFASLQMNEAALEPLTQFGFTVHELAPSDR